MAAQDSGEDGLVRAQAMQNSCSGGGAEARRRQMAGAGGLPLQESTLLQEFGTRQTDRALAVLRGLLGR